ncbi:MAG TPA: DHH family phosphoesterase, partial [Candidatus Limnocylindria bacterium]|nr:DHH family phosphoesterase [Candidatus Limnocylindria bacterium]
MELTVEQQIFDQVKKSHKILIVLPQSLTADSVASGLALKLFLTKMQKEAQVATSGQVPKALAFLPGINSIQKEIASVKSFVISVDTAVKKLEEVSYQTAGEKVNIYLKSKGPQFAQEDLSFSTEKFPVDLVIVLEAKSMEDLGALQENNTDFFFETPKINIDHQAGNEYFGGINLVDITATSVAEILAELFQKYEEQLLDEDISTCLLTGIIDKTDSFQR